ncbi:hypothetical protein ACF0H5_011300 [Mactra antiquata]
MQKSDFLPTLYYGLKPVWVNRISRNDLHTVNCAKVVRSNVLASNGVIHLVDQVLQTFDMFGNMTDLMFRDSSQFSQIIQVLYTSEMFETLRAEGPFTMFAPSNYAFSRLNPLLLERVLREQKTAEALIRRHTTRGVYCSTAVYDRNKVVMLDGTRMKVQCKKNGHYLENSKIVKPDILAGNGIIHLINKIQLPNDVLTMDSVARELRLTKFLQLSYEAGLLDKLQANTEMTLFAPSDEAFNDLPKEKRIELNRDPALFEEIFDYLVSIGKVKTDHFVGEHGIIMNIGKVMKISVHREGILVDDASIISPNNECRNGIVHVIDKVLYPPVTSIFDFIKNAEDLSIFRKGLEYAEITELLLNKDLTFTVFVPTDQAFNKLPVWQFDALFDKKETVKMLMQHHIVKGLVIYRTIPPESLIRLTSLQDENLVFQRGRDEKYFVDVHSDIVEDPVIASNGVLYKIDRVLNCDCKRDPHPG